MHTDLKQPTRSAVSTNTGVFISEASAVQDVKSGDNDWIELHNGSGAAVDLTGWTLSDIANTPVKFTFSAKTIDAGGYLVVECTSNKLRQNADIAPFSLSTGGRNPCAVQRAGHVSRLI